MITSSWWDPQARDGTAALRETRSGLTGFGRRPERHPTWQEPAGDGLADPAEGASAVVLSLAEPLHRQRP